MRIILLAVLITVVTGCAAQVSATVPATTTPASETQPEKTVDQKAQWGLMVGSWHGKQALKDVGSREWITIRSAEGKYKIKLKSAKPGECEVGEWGVSGEIYFTSAKGWLDVNQFTRADPKDPANRTAYDIIQLTETTFSYQHRETGEVLTEVKVSDDFTF